jgi:hypothetical protein
VGGRGGGALVGVFLSFRKERGRRKTGEKNLLPLPRVSTGRRRPTMLFKMASFGAFFFEQWMKRCCFGQNMPFNLKGNGSKIVSKSKSVFNL